MKSLTIRKVWFLGFLVFGLSCNEADTSNGTDEESTETGPETGPDAETEKLPITRFTAIGDVPYTNDQRQGLDSLIARHNEKGNSTFVFHVGDIKAGATPCDEQIYMDVAAQLRQFKTPTFITPGDNEYNDCENPEEGFTFWKRHFLGFHGQWDFEPTVLSQEERPENLMWVKGHVLYVAVNLVGSQVHDDGEWQARLTHNAQWVSKHLGEQKENVAAAVVFGHANMVEAGAGKFETFTAPFRQAAISFAKPILYLQGDGHFWFQNRPYEEKNILRVQIDGGKVPVQVIVDPNEDDPFTFDFRFLD